MTKLIYLGLLIPSLALGITVDLDSITQDELDDILSEPQEMHIPTDTGSIVLTRKPCPFPNREDFDYMAYASELGKPNHNGCWKTDADTVTVYYKEDNLIYIYNKNLFTPK